MAAPRVRAALVVAQPWLNRNVKLLIITLSFLCLFDIAVCFGFSQRLTQPLLYVGTAGPQIIKADQLIEMRKGFGSDRDVFYNYDYDPLLAKLRTYRLIYGLGQVIQAVHYHLI